MKHHAEQFTLPNLDVPKTLPNWPPKVQSFLKAFYAAKGVDHLNEEVKKATLKQSYGLEHCVLTTDDLRTTEFYVLTKLGILT